MKKLIKMIGVLIWLDLTPPVNDQNYVFLAVRELTNAPLVSNNNILKVSIA